MKRMTRYVNPISLNLRFFDSGEKTEKPTAKKKSSARKEGQVAKSQEVNTAFLLLSSFFALQMFAGSILEGLMRLFNFEQMMLGEIIDTFERVYIASLVPFLFQQVLSLVAPLFIVVMAVGVLVNIRQVGWKITTKPLRPKFSKLNPLKGFKRFFSLQALVTLVKSLLKFTVIGIVLYNFIVDRIDFIPALLDMSLMQAVSYIGDMIVTMGLTVGMMFIFVAALDYAYTRYKHNKDLKMTKQEVKDEWKQAEGNPQVKRKIRQKMQEVSMRRMMQSVPQADVVITNPTHYAVALRYDKLKDQAPVLVAKGVDYVAKRIRDLAREHKIEIVENPPLARAIYSDVEVNREIPPELWEAVADIIAYVFKLKNKN